MMQSWTKWAGWLPVVITGRVALTLQFVPSQVDGALPTDP